MAKLTPNIPYDDLGDSCQIAEYHAAWVMESSSSTTYLALSDCRPECCGSKVARRASFEDIEALAGGLPMLSQRSYRIGSEQGIVVLTAAMIVRVREASACAEASALPNRRYRWVVALEPSIVVEVNDPPVVPRRVVDHFGGRESVESDRASTPSEARSPLAQAELLGLVETERSHNVSVGESPRLLIRRR